MRCIPAAAASCQTRSSPPPVPRGTSSQRDITKLPTAADGWFQRAPSSFHYTIEPAHAQSRRYHLDVSLDCRALLSSRHVMALTREQCGRRVRSSRGSLTGSKRRAHIGITIVTPRMTTDGWAFGDVDLFPCAETDPNEGARYLKDIYFKPRRTTLAGQQRTIVNNESSEIICIFGTAFNVLVPPDRARLTLYPKDLRTQINGFND
ncbi:hypothetical protein AURDEDRAFT_159240 [Auricularia subglabra TFB-10046 SS5]|nr:hypothetical protein AURDEDRAFT_159240 [Auricularia subglabra TFB-10046 SS5]